jgi:hypothetical protein
MTCSVIIPCFGYWVENSSLMCHLYVCVYRDDASHMRWYQSFNVPLLTLPEEYFSWPPSYLKSCDSWLFNTPCNSLSTLYLLLYLTGFLMKKHFSISGIGVLILVNFQQYLAIACCIFLFLDSSFPKRWNHYSKKGEDSQIIGTYT